MAKPVPVSVVMPVRRSPDAAAVAAVLGQSFPDFELLLVGDADAPDDPRVRVVADWPSEARGDLVAVCGPDAVYDPDRLRAQVEFLAANPRVGVVGSHAAVRDAAGAQVGYLGVPEDHARIVAAVRRYPPFVMSAVMARRELLAGALDGPGAAHAFAARMARSGVGMANIPLPLVAVRAFDPLAARAELRAGAAVKRRYFAPEFGPIDFAYHVYDHALLTLPPSWVAAADDLARRTAGTLAPVARGLVRRVTRAPEERRHPRLAAPVFVRRSGSDADVFRQVIDGGEYDFPLAPAPRVIVDAGANIGLTTVHYANAYPDARIVAVEPDAANFAVLQRNCAAYPNVRAVRAALWSEAKTLILGDPGIGGWGFRVGERARGVEVPGVPLGRLLDEHGIDRVDLLKVDIEGAEKEVFEHAAGWIDRVEGVVVETHDRFKPGCSRAVLAATRDFAVVGARGELALLLRRGGCLSYRPLAAA